MKKRLLFGFGGVVLAISVLLVAWQGSFSLGQFDPSNLHQTFIFWATSVLIFVLKSARRFRQRVRSKEGVEASLRLTFNGVGGKPLRDLLQVRFRVRAHTKKRGHHS